MRALERVGPETVGRPQRPGVRRAVHSAPHTWTLQRSARTNGDARPDSRTSPETLLALQRTAGNGAVADFIGGAGPAGVQRAPETEPKGAPGPGTEPKAPGPTAPTAPTGVACCDALTAPASCGTDPMACPPADWEAAIRACLQTVRVPATATFGAEILRSTDREIKDDVTDVRARNPKSVPAGGRVAWFVREIRRACARRARELEVEYRFNVMFENVPGNPKWGEKPPWPDVITALAAIPEEHLSRRRDATQPVIFRRISVDPWAKKLEDLYKTGGRTLDAPLGRIDVYNPGVGRALHRGVPGTSQTIRHEVGHAVEPLVADAEKERFKRIVGWRDYSWGWVKKPPSPICGPKNSGFQEDPCKVCWELGFLGPGLTCDEARLQAFVAKVDKAPQVRGDKTYQHDESDETSLASYVTANVPSVRDFWYARTNFKDYFAEVYTFALSRPEWLRKVLPPEQTTWLEDHLFSTRAHYDQIVAPVVAQIGILGLGFAAWARQQFTKQQLENVAAQARLFVRPAPP